MCFPQTLGHLEKAVVLELTLKHVKALTSLLEQQQQKILALQNGMQIGELADHSRTHAHTQIYTWNKMVLFDRMQITKMNTKWQNHAELQANKRLQK